MVTQKWDVHSCLLLYALLPALQLSVIVVCLNKQTKNNAMSLQENSLTCSGLPLGAVSEGTFHDAVTLQLTGESKTPEEVTVTCKVAV